MTFMVTSERESHVRYEKIGRLRPGENGMIDVIRDGNGVIRSILSGDLILLLNGLSVPDLKLSESGNRIIISDEYVVLVTQVRGMIRDWPKKKAALFLREQSD